MNGYLRRELCSPSMTFLARDELIDSIIYTRTAENRVMPGNLVWKINKAKSKKNDELKVEQPCKADFVGSSKKKKLKAKMITAEKNRQKKSELD